MKKESIIVFDSGFGGISVLKRLVELMPNEDYVYYGDSANAPYGPRSKEQIQELTLNAISEVEKQYNPKAIVIACNTATAMAKDILQEKYPKIPVIGILPAVKAAAEKNSCILVLATAGTISSDTYKSIVSEISKYASIVSVAAPEIVHFVENGMKERNIVYQGLTASLLPYKTLKFDSVVLGCTHFPFATELISDILGYSVNFIDGSTLTAKQTMAELVKQQTQNSDNASGSIRFMNSMSKKDTLGFAWKLFSTNLQDVNPI